MIIEVQLNDDQAEQMLRIYEVAQYSPDYDSFEDFIEKLVNSLVKHMWEGFKEDMMN